MSLLVRRAIRGDTEAFLTLMEENKQMLYKVARTYLKNEEDVADVLQDTILAAYQGIGRLESPQYFRTWLARILINRCLDLLREAGRWSGEETPEQVYANRELEQLEFQQLLELLPQESRTIFLLYYGEDFGVREIGALLGLNENTVKTRLRRGRALLAEKLEKKKEGWI